MALPGKKDLKFVRGDTQDFTIQIMEDGTTPRNLTGYTFAAQIRTEPNAGSISASFTCTVPNPSNGTVRLVLPAVTSATLPDDVLYWDFQQTFSGDVTTLLAGKCTVVADVTR